MSFGGEDALMFIRTDFGRTEKTLPPLLDLISHAVLPNWRQTKLSYSIMSDNKIVRRPGVVLGRRGAKAVSNI